MYRPILVALAGFVAVALAASGPNPFNVPEGFSLTAGKPTTLDWTPTTVSESWSVHDLFHWQY